MKIYDSKSGELRQLEPVQAGRVGIYVCGPTVQSAPHIGHLRSALVYDILTRWLERSGLDVTLIRNVTDIDDKVLERARETGSEWWQLAYINELDFAASYKRIGIQAPSYEPRATGHIPEMLELIELLIERGYAYRALDSSADVFFDTARWPAYGELTNQKPEDMEASDSEASDSGVSGKRSTADFALWKSRKKEEPATASWPSAFGLGRPGWHIECSAMATKYLGTNFDIHGGGLDLRFPHHENELAQSRAAGHEFANLWMHNGLVNVGGQKMSKSSGNSVLASELFELASPAAVRYYLASAHYRSVLDYQPGVLAEAETALERIYEFLQRADRALAITRFAALDPSIQAPVEFEEQMNEDLNVPAALAVLHETVRQGNTALDEEQLKEAHRARGEVEAMLAVLGLSRAEWLSPAQNHAALDALVKELIHERNQAREAKDYALADAIRVRLANSGIELSDDSNTTHWSFN